MRYRVGLVIAFPLIALLFASSRSAMSAEPVTRPASGPVEAAQELQAKAWENFYAHKYDLANKVLQPLAVMQEAYRVEAMHCQARCEWAKGTPESMAKAKQMWATLAKQSTRNSLLVRLRIAEALQLAADKRKEDEAIKLLEGLLKTPLADTCTAEASIELGRLYANSQKFDLAKRSYRYAVEFMEYQGKRELPAAVTTPFIDAAKRMIDRLATDADAGREPFEKAQTLRLDQHYPEAIKAYEEVLSSFAGTEYALRSEVEIGGCLARMKKYSQAVDRWERFISTNSAGPWRGQAYLELIRLFLNDSLSLDAAAKYVVLGTAAMESAMKDPAAAPSWSKASAEFYIEAGLVAMLQGKSDAVSACFDKAIKGLPDADKVKRRLPLLSASCKANKRILPKEVAGDYANNRVALALGLGTLYSAIGRYDHATAMFDRAVSGELKGCTEPQKAFAAFGKGICLGNLTTSQAPKVAQDAILSSFKGFPAGSWHPATLCQLASWIEESADNAHGQAFLRRQKAETIARAEREAREKAIKEGKDPKVAVEEATGRLEASAARQRLGLTAAEREKQQKEERSRLTNLLQARAEAVQYWRELGKRAVGLVTEEGGDAAGYAETAAYHVAAIQAELALQMADGEPSAATSVREAAAALSSFVSSYSGSPWAGDVLVRRLDMAIRKEQDLVVARKTMELALAWAGGAEDKMKGAPLPALNVWEIPGPARPDDPTIRRWTRDLLVGAGIVNYLAGEYEQAASTLKKAMAISVPTTNAPISVPLSLDTLLASVAAKQKLTPDAVSDGDEKAAFILRIADIYYRGGDFADAMRLVDTVLSKEGFGTGTQRSWAFYRRGRMSYCSGGTDFDPTAAEADYLQSVKLDPKSSWAYDALFLAANIQYNVRHDSTKAIELWRRLVNEYPSSREATRSAYFVGVALQNDKRVPEARRAFQELIDHYPESPFVKLAKARIKQIDNQVSSRPAQPSVGK